MPHHHVRSTADIARVARLLTGRGLGIVLSGGGARGFAHIGVLRAMREAGIDDRRDRRHEHRRDHRGGFARWNGTSRS